MVKITKDERLKVELIKLKNIIENIERIMKG